MLNTKKDERVKFVFDLVMNLAGGQDKYAQSTLGAIWAECERNTELKNLAGLYLAGSSDRAEQNLAKLKAKVYSVFLPTESER